MSNVLQTHGNERTMNLNSVIYQNIVTSPYLKTLVEMTSYQEVLNEAIRNVRSMEPFLKGTTPSTAWVLMYKFWTLPLTVRQIEAMIDHPTSVYVRGIAFLYLRFVCKPDQLWDWFGDYLEDDTEIMLQGGHKSMTSTIGKMCFMLLKDQKFLGQMLPRIPVLIMRDLEGKLEPYASLARGSGGGGSKGGRDRRDGGGGGGGSKGDRDRDFRGRRDEDDRGGYRRSRDEDRGRDRSRDRGGRYDDDRGQGDRGGRGYYDRDRDYRSSRRRSHSRSRSPSRDRHRRRDRSRSYSPRRY
ncbi:PRP38 pre-mRNA processing factor 38 domain-containing protein B [Actinomortierella ambigua]|uniref:Pre-mRNA-splicing factor 38 n=1 Tax=Actinomortierella ambigua TaxID=1343610 RepID=A0A9P6Q1Z0_9FUNG|nr:PRP38 pre-mRNA processing factor 38 domain-containing protein B [Actinomortierella ambigua]